MVKQKMNKRGGGKGANSASGGRGGTGYVTRGMRATANEEWEPQEAPTMPESSSDSSGGSDSSDSETDDETKAARELAKKPQSNAEVFDVENLNRVVKKITKLTLNQPVELSRRDREAQEKAAATAHYQRMHAEGKTSEAQTDLARLAVIRKKREDAIRKREAEEKQKVIDTKAAARKR